MSRWRFSPEPLSGGNRYRILTESGPASFAEFFETLASTDELTGFLAATEFDACFWELPPLTLTRLSQPAEFVLIDAPALATARANGSPFAEAFAGADGQPVVGFTNLGGDARLIAPCPITPSDWTDVRYAHLGVFARDAPSDQARALWQVTAREVMNAVSDRPLWISTSGLGVVWLHIRLDDVPKYYTHMPYRSAPDT